MKLVLLHQVLIGVCPLVLFRVHRVLQSGSFVATSSGLAVVALGQFHFRDRLTSFSRHASVLFENVAARLQVRENNLVEVTAKLF